MTKTRILLVDDHDIVRLGLMTLLNDQPDMEVVGEASTAGEAVKAVASLRPDVVLMDIRLPGEGGIEATAQVMRLVPASRVVMLTSFADDELVVRAIRAGAVGYVLKQVGNEELLRAIRAAARGEALLDPSTTARLLSRVREAERKAETYLREHLPILNHIALALMERETIDGDELDRIFRGETLAPVDGNGQKAVPAETGEAAGG